MNKNYILLVILGAALLSGCAQTPREYSVDPTRMESRDRMEQESDEAQAQPAEAREGGITRLEPLVMDEADLEQEQNIALTFTNRDNVQVSANELPIKDFVQTVFGDTLGVNYVISPGAQEVRGNVTLNVSEPVSSRRLYSMTAELLDERGLAVTLRDRVYYVTRKDRQQDSRVVIGVGRARSDIPETINPILQIVPVRYGINTSLERTLSRLTSANISADYNQNALFVQAPRAEILRVLDLVNLLDRPSHRGKHVGLLELVYITPDEFTDRVQDLLTAEGIPSAVGPSSSAGVSLLMIPVPQVGAVALFAGEEFVIERAEYWARQVDKPSRGKEKRYYVFHPRYSRAYDLGQSVAPLLGGVAEGGGSDGRDTQSSGSQPVAGSQPRSGRDQGNQRQTVSVNTDDIRMTVDERSNSLIFYTTGETYQSLIPIMRRLDVMPKQILLDATIAEVTLTDEFAQGFEFAFRSGRLSGGTLGRLGVEGMGGLALNWSDGVSEVIARLSANTSLVNVLSNPTLVVRDGVSASISVGNDIPTIGATTSDPLQSDRQTTVVNYRKTGVNLTVTPTINAQGVVVLEIDQQISNTADSGPSIAGSPSIFERSIKTEVLAQSGQTILLGGLISENTTSSDGHIPGLARIPLLGHLFRGQSESREKTELVIFITPRVIDSVDQWTEIRSSISEGLTNLKIVN